MKKAEQGKTGLLVRIRRRKCAMNIQNRIFLYFLLFTGLLLVLLWLFQIVFLDSFYRLQKTGMMKSASDSIARNIQHEEIDSLIQRIAEQNDLCVLVTDEDMNTLYNVEGSFGCVIHHMGRRDLRRFTTKVSQSENASYEMFPMQPFRNKDYDEKNFDGRVPPPDRGDAKSIISVQRVMLDSGDVRYVFLNAIVTPINATVETIRNELLVITAILVLLSFLLSSLLSRRISKPIVKTTEAARALSRGEYTPIQTPVSYREIVELNSQLVQAAKDLHRVEEMQRELIANISHDLRTPLTLIEGYVEVMRDLPGENTAENMQVVLDETRRLTTLVNAILDYSKGKNTSGQLKLERFNLTESIREIIQRYGKLTGQDGYHIVFEPDREAYVRADALKVSQVIYNLTNNALTYTGEDKTVTIRQRVENGQVKILIHDSGEGIDANELPYIWTRYYRGQKPHKRPAVGTGLGLNIAQGIMDEHGMDYGVESEADKGSTFWFSLPESMDE